MTRGTIAFRYGLPMTAAIHCTPPTYESPCMPMFPSHQGCDPSHSMVSCPSSYSLTQGLKRPSESLRPRQSWAANTYPFWAKKMAGSTTHSDMLSYGVLDRITGKGPSRRVGK